MRRFLRPEILLTLLLLAGAAAMLGSTRQAASAGRDTATWAQVLSEVRVALPSSRIAVEESAAGARDPYLAEQALTALDQAGAGCRALLSGTDRVPPLPEAKVRRRVASACGSLVRIEDLVADRLGSEHAVEDDSRIDQQYEAAFDGVTQHFRRAALDLAAFAEADARRLDRLNLGMLGMLVLLFGGLIAALSRAARRRTEQRRLAETIALEREEQAEFATMLQAMRSEQEADRLLVTHVERSIPGARVTTLRRNPSGDRLEATSPLAPGSPLLETIHDADPASCLAIRLAQPSPRGGERRAALVQCGICGKLPQQSTCIPSLVGGEVVGSVLIEHERPLADQEQARVSESVTLAAPVLANLRNLAVAERRALTDQLTGLANRRAGDDVLKRMIAESRRNALPLTAVAFDLDRFKLVNDTYGHQAGDEVLAAVGQAVRQVVRESDFACRFGGEEFLLLLPGTDREAALTLVERLQDAIREVRLQGRELRVSASFGAAEFPVVAPDGDALLRAADRALYLAKRNGRDRIEIAEPDSPRILIDG